MNDIENKADPADIGAAADSPPPQADPATIARQMRQDRIATRRWWIRLFVPPMLLLGCGVLLIVGLGVAQRLGFVSAGGGGGGAHATAGGEATRYICPMMCTAPQTEPGRCPVCAMDLVPAMSGGGSSDSRSIQIDPAARRIANIRTAAVESMPMSQTIRAIGELNYDESTLKTLSAYVDGRLDRLYADYTGVVVNKGDHLALVYSPRLYSGQVELLLARKARDNSRSATLQRVVRSNQNMYESATQRLIELGMTQSQIEQLEQAGEANSRMHLCAPMSGTVIEKFAVEGSYIKEGQPIYRLADLSTVWLMLQLFPEDAARIRYGQEVEAAVQSLPGRQFVGRVAFIDPHVDPKTRTVGVRVVVPNQDGSLRVGDYAKAAIHVPLRGIVDNPTAGNPTAGNRAAGGDVLVVPRDAVLMAGDNSVIYVETEPGRFEIRRVVLGPSCGDRIVVLSGVSAGEQVATRGNFLIDSQMQLAGNPSLIDPTRAGPLTNEGLSPEVIAALSTLSPEDRELVEKQGFCPVADLQLGSMGTPIKVDVNGTPVFICCGGCRESLLEEPRKYLAKLAGVGESGRASDDSTMNLPPIGAMEQLEPRSGLPPIASPQAIIQAEHDGPLAPGPRLAPFAELPMEIVR